MIEKERKKIMSNIVKIAASKGLKKQDIARKSGVNGSQLSKYLDLTNDITLSKLLQIANGIGSSLTEILEFDSESKALRAKLSEITDSLSRIEKSMSQKE